MTITASEIEPTRKRFESPGLAGARTPRPAGPAQIYVVDDELMVGEVLQAILQLAGFSVAVFQEPLLALHALAETPVRPRLLLTDFAMGPVNGVELIRAAKMVAPELKTILIGGRVSLEPAPGDGFHADRFLAKPFQPHLLLGAVREVLALGSSAV